MTQFRRALLGLLSPEGARARLLILTFHQVAPEPDPLAPSVPDVRLFSEQMQWLKAYCTVLPLPEAAEMLKEGKLPARSACITFDDGYADNHDNAAPVLRKLGLDATFFITAGAVDDGVMWNDLVIEGVRSAEGCLDLRDLGLGEHPVSDSEARREAIAALIAELKYRQPPERRACAEAVFLRSGDTQFPRLMMTREQVASLGRSGFDIGAHTIGHPILKEIADDAARAEIEHSRDWVRDVTGSRPASFAYPNGRPGLDFTAEHERMVETAQFRVAVSTRWGAAHRGESLFALSRFAPWECHENGYWRRLGKTLARSYLPAG